MLLADHAARVGGTVLDGRYRLDALLGAGGYGAVYAATHRWSGRRVALKILPCETDRSTAVATALTDARAPVLVEHPHVVQVLDAGGDDFAREVYVVTELLTGPDLRGHLAARGGRLGIAEAVELLAPIMDALAAAHAVGLSFLDGKPDNVVLDVRGGRTRPVLIDFGIARAVGLRRRDATGQMVGTPHYMPPEQFRGDAALGPAADVWAMGVILHECLTGAPPYDGENVLAVASQVLCAEAPPDVAADVPRPVAVVIRRALEPDPARRWTMADMREALLDAAEVTTCLPRAPRLPPRAPVDPLGPTLRVEGDAATVRRAAPRRARPWRFAAGAAAGLLAAALGTAATHGRAEQSRPMPAAPAPASNPVQALRPTPTVLPGAPPVRVVAVQADPRSEIALRVPARVSARTRRHVARVVAAAAPPADAVRPDVADAPVTRSDLLDPWYERPTP